jgi:hypothetical protein
MKVYIIINRDHPAAGVESVPMPGTGKPVPGWRRGPAPESRGAGLPGPP